MKIALLGFVIMLMMSFALVACGDNATDQLLADREKVVLAVEELAKKESISAEDFQKVTEDFQDFGAKFSGADAPKFTEGQAKRFQDLSSRWAAAYQQLSAKIK
jgi:hypothetical protein